MKTKKYILIALTFLAITNSSYAQICFVQTDTIAMGTSPGSLISFDFNKDGKKDLATANANTNNVSVLLGTGTGNFGTVTNFSVGSSPRQVCSADFNGDGKLDLAVTNYVSNNISILLGDGLGSFGAAVNYTTSGSPESICSADFNKDGKADLAVTTTNNINSISVLFGTVQVVLVLEPIFQLVVRGVLTQLLRMILMQMVKPI